MEGNMYIAPGQKELVYCGRIDFDMPNAPVLVYPCSYVKMRFTGTSVKAHILNQNHYWENYLGIILDGRQSKIKLDDTKEKQTIVLGENLSQGEHEVLLFKRQDACHIFNFYGFELDDQACVLPLKEEWTRRIEVYGDSVSAGEISEAVDFVGKEDPVWQQGELSNSWYSYAWITARKLHAQIHDIAQGGIALLNGTGYFSEPDYIGMESVFDKIQYNPAFGIQKAWDFTRYQPHVVVVAIGQNDKNPEDYMKENRDCAKAVCWRRHYHKWIETLRQLYPKAEIILSTTIMEHDPSWDEAIEQVCVELKDKKIHHFMYSANGRGTPGHIRISEAEQMAEELSGFIRSLGEQIWEEV